MKQNPEAVPLVVGRGGDRRGDERAGARTTHRALPAARPSRGRTPSRAVRPLPRASAGARDPLVLVEDDVEDLGRALDETPEIRRFLARLLEDA